MELPIYDQHLRWSRGASFLFFSLFHDTFSVCDAPVLALSLSYAAYLMNPLVIMSVDQGAYFPGEPMGRKLSTLPRPFMELRSSRPRR